VKLRASRARLAALLPAVGALLIAAPTAGAAPITVGHSGWDWGNPLPQGNALRAVDFLGPIGYAVGDYGTVLASDDGGATWRGLVSGSTDDLSLVQMIDVGSFVVAGECTVLRSDNGGASFRSLPWADLGSRCRSPVVGISFPTTDTGYVLRADGRVYRTDDGGDDWQEVTDLTVATADQKEGSATDIAFRDASTGFATTDEGIYRTTDGGLSWPLVANAPLTGLDGIDLAGVNVVYAVGTGTVFASMDDGRTWSAKPLSNAFRSTRLTSVHCADAKLCLITTDPGERVLRTVNGGASFVSLPAPVPGTLAIEFTSPGSAVATGQSGKSAVSADAGATWSRVDGGIDGSFTQLRGDSGSLAFAIGQQGALARTLDGGDSWQTVLTPTTADVIDVSFIDEQTGFLLDQDGVLYRTDDGCASWRVVFQDAEHAPQAVVALDLDRVLLIGARGILASLDGGEKFGAVRQRAVKRASLFGVDRGGGSLFAYGPTSLFSSLDRGRTWWRIRRPDHRPLAVVDFAGSKVGYALGKGGRVWRTRNRGRSWREMLAAGTDGGISLAAVDAREAYIASNDLFFSSGANRPDYLLHTTDGGRSWRPQLVNDSRNVSGLLATQASTGLLLAGGNLLFTTFSGGDRGGRSIVTSRASKRRLIHPGRVRVSGRLRPAKGGERVIVSRANADPRQRRGSIDWDFKSARVRSNGTFATTWRVRRTSVFVAQWTGDGYRMGAGSRLVRVRVVHHR
jgi:photosystem II stability/assembly factor-like uncharacterized protein